MVGESSLGRLNYFAQAQVLTYAQMWPRKTSEPVFLMMLYCQSHRCLNFSDSPYPPARRSRGIRPYGPRVAKGH